MSRRQTLAALALSPLATVVTAMAAPQHTRSATFILVHGAWHGAWCWQKLTPLLRARGHQVHTPTLTGLGERAHLLTPQVGLDTHVQDVAAVLEYEDLTDVILVGHSYGGMVISGVAERAPARVAQLVYLDAFMPEDGKAVKDYAPLPPTSADGWRIPQPNLTFGVTDKRDLAWMMARLGDQPLKAFTQPAKVSAAGGRSPLGTYILTTRSRWFVEASERAKQQGYRWHELLEAGHNAMMTQPEKVADLLHQVV
jgi:pimeloyl-ACP methyl ester carboxylesterase